MNTLTVELAERSYPILIGAGLLNQPKLLAPFLRGTDVLLVSNSMVQPLYAARIEQQLPQHRVLQATLPDGEMHKTHSSITRLLDVLIANRFNRDCTLIALGGGVVGDITGFAAACYQRGVDYLQIPTTLLAQVDSSVGGKTGVNHPGGKNLIGAFHQPRAVIADTETLNTLPDRELRAGLAEVIKYGLIYDAVFLTWLEDNIEKLLKRDSFALAHAIERSCAIKAEIVARDEHEQGERALLNFGHTFGHAIEAATGYSAWLHGEAVAVGMLMAARLSAENGWLREADVARIERLLQRAGLPCKVTGVGSERLLELMRLDKKVQQGQIRFVMLRAVGEAAVSRDYGVDALMNTLQRYLS